MRSVRPEINQAKWVHQKSGLNNEGLGYFTHHSLWGGEGTEKKRLSLSYPSPFAFCLTRVWLSRPRLHILHHCWEPLSKEAAKSNALNRPMLVQVCQERLIGPCAGRVSPAVRLQMRVSTRDRGCSLSLCCSVLTPCVCFALKEAGWHFNCNSSISSPAQLTFSCPLPKLTVVTSLEPSDRVLLATDFLQLMEREAGTLLKSKRS